MARILQIVLDGFCLVLVVGSIGWIFFRALKHSDDVGRLVFKWILTALLMAMMFYMAVPMYKSGGLGGIMAIGLAGIWSLGMIILWRSSLIDLLANPIASLYDGGKTEIEPKPYYSIALTKRNKGKPLEAIVEIRRQLAKFPNDFEGVTMLANIQAEDLKDLPSAENTFNQFCDRPEAPPKQVAAALTQLADWHLKLAQDVESARAVLGKLAARYPDTAIATQAAQRLAHLGGTHNILMAAQDRQAVFVPEGVKNVGLLDSSRHLIPAEADPEQLAADYVKHLEIHPQDTEAREKLAVIYAQHYQRLDMAAQELMQLADLPGQPPKRVAHWLNLLADLQVHGGADYETARATLAQIVERFPGLPAADIAQLRLARLKLEIKGQEKTPGKKLGVYEQNIGLKYGSPRQL
jgi:tetratricopeptide (TPR) repeat protein